MTVLKVKNSSGAWIPVITGPLGPPAYVVQPEAPGNPNVLWLDSDEEIVINGVRTGEYGVLKYTINGGNTWLSMLGGPQGVPGVGIATGGTVGQALVKKSAANYDTEWKTYTTETFLSSNLPTSWASGLYITKTGSLTNISGQMTCLLGGNLIPITGKLTVVVAPVGFRPQYSVFGTCVWTKAADANFRKNFSISIETNGNLTFYSASDAVSPDQYFVNDVLHISVTYRSI